MITSAILKIKMKIMRETFPLQILGEVCKLKIRLKVAIKTLRHWAY